MSKPHLYHFGPHEFVRADKYGNPASWFDQMDHRLLVLLDLLRYRLNSKILISGHDHALGRQLGPDNLSQHNIDRWGNVRAVDVLLPRVRTQDDAYRLYDLVRECGFTGFGFAPFWRPHAGAHLDVRHERRPEQMATWGYVLNAQGKQVIVPLEDAIEAME